MGTYFAIPVNVEALWMALGSGTILFVIGMVIRKVLMIRFRKWAQKTGKES